MRRRTLGNLSQPQFVFLHGISQRSGTNHLLHLLSRHPRVVICPKRIWELPFLSLSYHLIDFNREFAVHPKVLDVADTDLLPQFGRAFLDYLAEEIPGDRVVLLKQPSVDGIGRFFDFFPAARLVLIVRDGRDVACSAMKTGFSAPPSVRWRYPGTYRYLGSRPVERLGRRWAGASRMLRDFLQGLAETEHRDQVTLVRYEDLVREPEESLSALLRHLTLDSALYDWAGLREVPVRGSSFVDNRGEQGLSWQPAAVCTSGLKPIGRWGEWSCKDKALYWRTAGAELGYWGYGAKVGALGPAPDWTAHSPEGP